MSAPMDEAVEVVARALSGRCSQCLRPVATDDEWKSIPAGEGDHLCWGSPGACLFAPDVTLQDIVIDALSTARFLATEQEWAYADASEGDINTFPFDHRPRDAEGFIVVSRRVTPWRSA